MQTLQDWFQLRSITGSFSRGMLLLLLLLGCTFTSAAQAADDGRSPEAGTGERQAAATEETYYRLHRFQIPDGEVIEASCFQHLPDGRVAVGSRRGEIWMIENATSGDIADVRFSRFAHGLHEVLSLAWNDGWLYATQRPEVTRIRDQDGDGTADLFETFCDDWGLTGDYHEYAFASKFDSEGHLWVTLCLTGSFDSKAKWRGWALRIDPAGHASPVCSGIRSPGGMGINTAGDVFYTDNQGPWNGTCTLRHLKPGKFMGHPAGLVWYDRGEGTPGEKPAEPESGSRLIIEAERIEQLEPPAVMFPYNKMGQSASGIACDTSGGDFGPFAGQLFVGDQTHSTVMRVFLEQVDGHYQGACFPFRSGFGSGSLGVEMLDSGQLMVGGTNRGWGSRGRQPFAIERLDWTGRTPLEIHQMRVQPDGFVLTFTHPVDPKSAADPESYDLSTYTYIYQSSYGSPEVDHTEPRITGAEVGEDERSVRLTIDGLQRGHVHELHADGIRGAESHQPLLHPVAYYTLNYLPKR